jgi:hypothetical protein
MRPHDVCSGVILTTEEVRSGDGPLSVRVRPSSLKRDCAPGQPAQVEGAGQRTREVTLDPGASADTPVRNQGPGRSLPGPDAGHPLQGAGGHGAASSGQATAAPRAGCAPECLRTEVLEQASRGFRDSIHHAQPCCCTSAPTYLPYVQPCHNRCSHNTGDGRAG